MQAPTQFRSPPVQGNKESRHRSFAKTEDERQLLGDFGDPREKSSAVSIPTPRRERPPDNNNMRAGSIPGGFRPINTLTMSSEPQQYSNQNRKQPVISEATRRPGLQVEISKGNNVPQHRASTSGTSEYEQPSPKRRKLESHANTCEGDPQSSDGVDPLHMGAEGEVLVSLARESSITSQTANGRMQVRNISQPTLEVGVAEYQNVENRMNSDPPKAIKRKTRSGNSQSRSLSTSESVAFLDPGVSTASNPIQLSDDDTADLPGYEVPSKPRNQSMGKRSAGLGKGVLHQPSTSHLRVTEERSSHFPRIDSPIKETKLNDQFIATNGERRHEEYSSSADELAESSSLHIARVPNNRHKATNLATSRSASPVKSSSSTRKGSPTREVLTGLEPSNVPVTKFKFPRSNEAFVKDHGQSTTNLEAFEEDWDFRLAVISMEGEILTSKNLGLVINHRTKAYEVHHGAINLALQDVGLQIHPSKLHSALWHGAKVRFQSARVGNNDCYLDLEMWGEKECQGLLRKLQFEVGNTLRTVKEEPRLGKMFERRLQEQKNERSKKRAFMSNHAVDQGEDVLLAAHNKAKRPRTHGTMPVEPLGTKTRLIDRMSDRTSNGQEQVKALIPGLTDRRQPPDMHESQEITDLGVSPSRISEITRSLQLGSQNSHVMRSRVSKQAASSQDLSLCSKSLVENSPQVYDLGEPWRRPLIYPKSGKKKSTVEWTDLSRLDEGEFFNDTLISFYLRYLEHRLEEQNPAMARKIYFFNTFFFASLTKTQRGKKGINYEAVQKWARGDIFSDYDYVVVPINESMHWYLAVICNLPAVDRSLSHLTDDTFSSPQVNPVCMTKSDLEGELSDPLSRSSISPAHETTEGKVHPVDAAAEENARSSFAELSLDQVDKPDDQKLLDAQFGNERPQPPRSLHEAPQQHAMLCQEPCQEPKYTSSSVEPETSKAATASKKKKRKSTPSGKKLDPTEPAIVTFDSLAMAHAPTVRILKDYLKAEAYSKRTMTFDESQLKGMTAIGIPKQDNYCDCGPYLLGYMDKFLEDPRGFMAKIMLKQMDPERDWPQLDPSVLRSSMRDLILSLHKEQEDERKQRTKATGTSKVPPKLDSSPPLDPLQGEQKPNANAQAVKHMLGSSTASQVKPGLANGHVTRKEALQHALRIDDTERDDEMKLPGVPQDDKTQDDGPVQEEPSLILIESQPMESQSAAPLAEAGFFKSDERVESPPPLPSTIPDSQSQRQEMFEDLEQLLDIPPRTPPRKRKSITPESTTSSLHEKTIYSPPLGRELVRQSLREFKPSVKSQAIVQID